MDYALQHEQEEIRTLSPQLAPNLKQKRPQILSPAGLLSFSGRARKSRSGRLPDHEKLPEVRDALLR